jgi:hypothetical protein
LTGGTDVHAMKRGVCSAGHKALWAAPFGGLPPDDFFASLDPLLTGFTSRLFTDTYTSDKPAGTLSDTGWVTIAGGVAGVPTPVPLPLPSPPLPPQPATSPTASATEEKYRVIFMTIPLVSVNAVGA